MKILLWVHKNDVMADKILTYHFTRPIIDRNDEYVQVTVSQDEFARLEDNKNSPNDWGSDHWLTNQYNRNRASEDKIESLLKLRMAMERGLNDNPIKIHKVFEQFPDYSDINLEQFAKWWEKMPEDRKEKFTEIFTKGYNEEN